MEKEIEDIFEYNDNLSAYEQSLVFAELSRRRGTFDVLQAQRLVAQLQFERLLNALESEDGSNKNVIDDRLAKMDKTLNELSRLEIERHTKKITITGEIADSSQSREKIKNEYIEKWGEKTANVLNNPDSKRRVMNVLEKFRAGANGVVSEILKNNDVIDTEKK